MVLEVSHIAKNFGSKKVLTDVNLRMERGSFCAIVGENGSGKSTLLKIIVGEWSGNRGRVERHGTLGYCPQQVLMFPDLTVQEHFTYFGAAYRMKQEEIQLSSKDLMEEFSYAEHRDVRVKKLSGGTQQKLNLSIALLHQPQLLILDEPYSGLDWETYRSFWKCTNRLRSEGRSVLIVTHLITDRSPFDKIYELKEGRLICT